MAIREGGFEFRENPTGVTVYYRRRRLGDIITMYEPGGRHCFRLGCDNRRHPRTYRGRVKAAEALRIVDSLKRRATKAGWTEETLVLWAWDEKPNTSW